MIAGLHALLHDLHTPACVDRGLGHNLEKQFLVTVKQTSKAKENIMKKTSGSAGKAFKVVGLVLLPWTN